MNVYFKYLANLWIAVKSEVAEIKCYQRTTIKYTVNSKH